MRPGRRASNLVRPRRGRAPLVPWDPGDDPDPGRGGGWAFRPDRAPLPPRRLPAPAHSSPGREPV